MAGKARVMAGKLSSMSGKVNSKLSVVLQVMAGKACHCFTAKSAVNGGKQAKRLRSRLMVERNNLERQ